MTAADKVLVVGPSWVGDMVMAQALYKLLRQRNPTAEIHVVAPPWSLPVLERMPEVARGIELAVGHGELGAAGAGARWAGAARASATTRAIVLPRSAKAALVPWFARVPLRTGFRGEWRYGLLNDVRSLDARLDQTVKRFVALGQARDEALPGSLPPALRPRLASDPRNLERLRAVHGLRPGAPLAALMPGAEYGPAKRWPARHYGALGRGARGRGRRRHRARLRERDGDRRRGRRRGPRSARVRNLCGRTSLADVVDLLAAADVAVSNDSGLLHVAAAAGAPVVADLWLLVAEVHAAAHGCGGRRLARDRVQPVLRARVPAQAPALSQRPCARDGAARRRNACAPSAGVGESLMSDATRSSSSTAGTSC